MEILEFGNKNKEVLLLIHGFESPYQLFEDYIRYFSDDYHIFVPILPGHNKNKPEEFVSFDKCVREINNYILQRSDNKVNIVAMSMGGVLASKLIQSNVLDIKSVIMDGSPLVGASKFMRYFLTKQYISMTNKTKKRNKRLVNQAVNSIVPKNKLNYFLDVIDTITTQSIVNYLKEIFGYKIPSTLDLTNIKLTYIHGTKLNEMLAKKTAKYLNKHYKVNTICFNGKGHCENSIFNTYYMCKLLKLLLLNK